VRSLHVANQRLSITVFCVSELWVDRQAATTHAVTKCEMKPELIAYLLMAQLRADNPLTRRFKHKMPDLPPPIPPARKAVR
jgi:hypothetical protein